MLEGKDLRTRFDIYTPEELAAALGVTTTTLAAWRSAGTGPRAVKLGKSVFYRCIDVTVWIDMHAPDFEDIELSFEDDELSFEPYNSEDALDGEEEAEEEITAGDVGSGGSGGQSNP